MPDVFSFLTLTLLIKADVITSADCIDGWFGAECQYQCHCTDDECDPTGRCHSCAPSHFGPGCQYSNLAFSEGSQTNPVYLTDFNDSSCNPNEHALTVKFTLIKELRVTWFRIRVKTRENIGNFTTKLNDEEDLCVKERRFIVDNLTIDVTCDLFIFVKLIVVYGKIASDVCSIYISGGRNVALKQQTTMSSTLVAKGALSQSENAVDGNTNPNFSAGTCYSSNSEPRGAIWSVTFAEVMDLYRIRVYSSNMNRDLLPGFTITMIGLHGQTFDVLTAPALPESVYDFVLITTPPVQTVQIKADYGNTHLTMCEVQIFGEHYCLEGTYGLDCANQCKCKFYETCNQVTGLCAPGCPAGFYGFQCQSRCDESCIDEVCMQRSGECFKCREGIGGEKCNKSCPSGTYGKNCLSKCSSKCKNTCNQITGLCECLPGYRPPLCAVCLSNTYGINCSNTCSRFCKRKCSPETGQCFNCDHPRTGLFCEACPRGIYGPTCSETCPSFCEAGICDSNSGDCFNCSNFHTGNKCQDCVATRFGPKCNLVCPVECLNGLCNASTGLCLSCNDEYSGPLCAAGPWHAAASWILIIPFLCAIAVFCVLLVLHWRRKQKKMQRRQELEKEHEHYMEHENEEHEIEEHENEEHENEEHQEHHIHLKWIDVHKLQAFMK